MARAINRRQKSQVVDKLSTTLLDPELGYGSDIKHRNLPRMGKRRVDQEPLQLPKLGTTEVFPIIIYPDAGLLTTRCLSQLFVVSQMEEPTALVTWYLSTSAVLFPTLRAQLSQLSSSLKSQGLVTVTCQDRNALVTLAQTSDRFSDLAIEDVSEDVPSDLATAMFCLTTLILGKNPTEEYWREYTSRRCANLAGIIGHLSTSELEGIAPTYASAKHFSTFMAPLSPLKRILITAISAASELPTTEGSCYRSTLGLLKNSGITQFVQIHNLLFSQAHPIISMGAVIAESTKYCHALEKWMRIPEAERHYIKIIEDPDKSEFMHRNKFPLLSMAAIHLATLRGQESLANYRPYQEAKERDGFKTLFEVVMLIEKCAKTSLFLKGAKKELSEEMTSIDHDRLSRLLQEVNSPTLIEGEDISPAPDSLPAVL